MDREGFKNHPKKRLKITKQPISSALHLACGVLLMVTCGGCYNFHMMK